MTDEVTEKMTAKNVVGPMICLIGCNGIMAYFFGIYWYKNPDEYGGHYVKGGVVFDCYAGTNSNTKPLPNWSIVGNKTLYPMNVT